MSKNATDIIEKIQDLTPEKIREIISKIRSKMIELTPEGRGILIALTAVTTIATTSFFGMYWLKKTKKKIQQHKDKDNDPKIKSEIEQLQNDLANITLQISQMSEKINQSNASNTSSQNNDNDHSELIKLNQLVADLPDLKKEIEELIEKVNSKEKNLQEYNSKLDQFSNNLSNEQKDIKEKISEIEKLSVSINDLKNDIMNVTFTVSQQQEIVEDLRVSKNSGEFESENNNNNSSHLIGLSEFFFIFY